MSDLEILDGIRYSILLPTVTTMGWCKRCGENHARGGGLCVDCHYCDGIRAGMDGELLQVYVQVLYAEQICREAREDLVALLVGE